MARKRTHAGIAAALGIDVKDISRAKKDGVDPYDDVAMKRWRANRNDYTPRQSEKEPPSVPSYVIAEGERLTIEQIEELAARPGQAKREVEVYRVQLDVMKAAAALRIQRNQLIPRDVVQEAMTRIGKTFAAIMTALISELPPICEGLSASASEPLIEDKVRKIQSEFANLESDFWKNHPDES